MANSAREGSSSARPFCRLGKGLAPFAMLGLAGVLLSWLKLGVVNHPEFSSRHLIVKNGQTFKVFFKSPIGDSDLRLEDLPPDAQQQELDYRRHVPPMRW